MSALIGSPEWFNEKAGEGKIIQFIDRMERLREEFLAKYSAEKLNEMSGDELLEKVFGDGNTMMFQLMYDDFYRDFGAIGTYKYTWIVYKEAGYQWKYKAGANALPISEYEAREKAVEIRDKLVYCVDIIRNTDLNTLSGYEDLETKLKDVFFSRYAWALKYYQMLFPQYFPGMYAYEKTISRALRILGLPNHGKSHLIKNVGEISLFIRKCDVNNLGFGHVYADQWGWEGNPPACPSAEQNYMDRKRPITRFSLEFYRLTDVSDDLSDSDEELIRDVDEQIESLGVEGKERAAIVKVRMNQNEFRKKLLRRYNKCCLCGVTNPLFLIASHIKPWAESEANEKLDVNNGLLLCPNHDQLFDQGFISFTEEGNILISSQLSKSDCIFLNVTDNMKLDVRSGNIKYMKYHRNEVFKP